MNMAALQFLFLLLLIVPVVLFLVTQQNTLKSIHPQNRSMQPGEVWLQLIPLFGLIWQFVVVSRLATSLRNEMASRTTTFSFETEPAPVAADLPKPTYAIGMAYCILICCSLLPMINLLASVPAMVCWIIYWVKLNEYKNQLQLRTI